MPEGGAKVALFVIEFILLLFFIFAGSRYGGIGIGMAGGVGVLVFCMFFQLEKGALPLEVIEIIMCVIAAIAALQTAGGMDWLVNVAERIMRKKPQYITMVAPIVTFIMTLLAGTGHTAFSTLPVIAEVAKVAGVRPSRPLSVAVTASQVAICCSPISAAVVALSSYMEPRGVSYMKLLGVLIPSLLISTVLTSFVTNFFGKELIDDPIYCQRWEQKLTQGGPIPRSHQSAATDLEEGSTTDESPTTEVNRSHRHSNVSLKRAPSSSASTLRTKEESQTQSLPDASSKFSRGLFGCPAHIVSVVIFLLAIIFIVVYATLISDTVGLTKDPPIPRTEAILSIMLTAAFLIVVICKVDTTKIPLAPTFRSGMTAVVCVVGVAWMGDTLVSNYLTDIEDLAGDVLRSQGWLLSVILFIASCLLYSQGVTVNALYPAALSIGVSNLVAVASFPACAALFVLPTYPTLLAAVEMDDTGTTRIGKYIFNHSFILPGLIHIVSSVLISFLFGLMILH